MPKELLSTRTSGVLLHPTSLPGPYGIGDLGEQAYKFVDFLEKAGQRLWSFLPIGPTFKEDYHCPYSSYSAFAGNPLLISPEKLEERGLVTKADLKSYISEVRSKKPNRVDFIRVEKAKENLFKKAFQKAHRGRTWQGVEYFALKNKWLDDFTMFTALRKKIGRVREQWNEDIRTKKPGVEKKIRKDLAEEMNYEAFLQYLFFEQWHELKNYANSKGVQMVGDLPIYLANDCADVWANSKYFALDRATGKAELVSGAPPDSFSKTGQLWNHPVYDWKVFERERFSWWVERMKILTAVTDFVRIDHFRGFAAFWAVPAGSKTAEYGKWYPCPGEKLFSTLERALGSLSIIIEDLGVITPDVEELRDKFSFMGMKVLQFPFESKSPMRDNQYSPFNFLPNYVVYTGTHDHDTSKTWFKKLSPPLKKRLLKYLNLSSSKNFVWEFIRLAYSSPARWAIIPMQDLLEEEIRMNYPGTTDWKNWSWRMNESASNRIAERLGELAEIYQRN